MRQAGVEAQLQEVEEGRANIIAVVRGAGDGPTLMLNGHLDTSYTGDFWEDYAALGTPGPNHRPEAYEIGDSIYGLGANNMKGGVAAAFSTRNHRIGLCQAPDRHGGFADVWSKRRCRFRSGARIFRHVARPA
jgi:arginine utilization protein RocB